MAYKLPIPAHHNCPFQNAFCWYMLTLMFILWIIPSIYIYNYIYTPIYIIKYNCIILALLGCWKNEKIINRTGLLFWWKWLWLIRMVTTVVYGTGTQWIYWCHSSWGKADVSWISYCLQAWLQDTESYIACLQANATGCLMALRSLSGLLVWSEP